MYDFSVEGCVFATIGNRSNQTFYDPAEYEWNDDDDDPTGTSAG